MADLKQEMEMSQDDDIDPASALQALGVARRNLEDRLRGVCIAIGSYEDTVREWQERVAEAKKRVADSQRLRWSIEQQIAAIDWAMERIK